MSMNVRVFTFLANKQTQEWKKEKSEMGGENAHEFVKVDINFDLDVSAFPTTRRQQKRTKGRSFFSLLLLLCGEHKKKRIAHCCVISSDLFQNKKRGKNRIKLLVIDVLISLVFVHSSLHNKL